MKELKLSQNKVALVDDADYDAIAGIKWYAHTENGLVYALCSAVVGGKNRKLRLHRVLMGVDDPKILVDHIDGDTLNYSRSNLRICSHAGNAQNRKINVNNTSGFKGVSFNRRARKFVAQIWDGKGKRLYLGHFATAEEASKVYEAKATELFGEFKRKV